MADTQAQIGFEQLGLGSVLKRYRLLVPPNQRDYAWTEKEVTTLLQDLTAAVNDDEPQHFLGTIVTIPRANGVLEVVDGQQRLATVAILLSVMKRLSEKINPNLARALESYLVDIDSVTLELSPKMRLNAADTQVFHDIITKGSTTAALPNRDSHRLLIDANKRITSHLGKLIQPVLEVEKVKIIQRWMNFIEHKARAILLIVPDSVNAFKMFETLNDRGLRVSQSDLVKNYIFGQSGDSLNEAQQVWAFIKGALETLDEDEITMTFLRQAIISINGYIRETQIYEQVQKAAKGPQSSISFLVELEKLSGEYVAIAIADNEKWNKYPQNIRGSLRVLQLFDIKPFRPLVLSIARRFSPNEAAKACQNLVSMGVRLIIASTTRSGSVEIPLATAAKLVFDGAITTADELRKNLASITPGDEPFRASFATASVSQAKFARYYLRSLELAANGQDEPWLIPNDDPDSINLEHVLPLKPMENWPNYDDDTIKLYARRIGNLALLQAKANSDLKSDAFDVKRPVLGSATYLTTKMIGEVEDWTPQAIEQRQQQLADLALKAWPSK